MALIDYELLINCSCIIKPFDDLEGTIIAVFITKKGVEYQVRYYLNGAQKTDYFFDWEIERTVLVVESKEA